MKSQNNSLKFQNSIMTDGVDLSCQEPAAVVDAEESCYVFSVRNSIFST